MIQKHLGIKEEIYIINKEKENYLDIEVWLDKCHQQTHMWDDIWLEFSRPAEAYHSLFIPLWRLCVIGFTFS